MQGYYLETCPKMRYKAEFHPSELLCMRSYAWVPLRVAVPAIRGEGHCTIGQVSSLTQARLFWTTLLLIVKAAVAPCLTVHKLAEACLLKSTITGLAAMSASTNSCGWWCLLSAASQCSLRD